MPPPVVEVIMATRVYGGEIFSQIKVSGQPNVDADSDIDTLTLIAGSNITLTTDATNDTVTISTTGLANQTHTGDATGATALTVVGINNTLLSGLATGILKNTTTTGVPSIAVAGDFPTLNQNTTGNAATVTTNASLAGVITSVGNITSIASQTGTGSKFVVDTSPTFITSITTPAIIGGTGTTSTLTYKTTTGIGVAGADHIFLVGNNGATEAMRILNSGYVGIGRTPLVPFDIYKGAVGPQLRISGNAVGGNDVSMDFAALNGSALPTYGRIGINVTAGGIGSETGELFFSTIDAGTLSQKMTILGGTVTAQTIVSTVVVRLKGYTVATLPAGTQGDTAFVTDATVVPAKGVAPVAGGVAIGVVFFNGTIWVGI